MDAQRLRAIPLFSTLSKKEAEQVARWTDEVDVPAGKHLVEQGRFAHEFFAIESGTAEVLVDGEKVAELGPGDFFGEIAILGDGVRTATVTSTSPTRLLVMFGTEFRQLEAAHPEIAAHIAEAMQTRVGQIAKLA
jgi:CRP/FNR family transcriptional regulator, cyclic AMP receptor protein